MSDSRWYAVPDSARAEMEAYSPMYGLDLDDGRWVAKTRDDVSPLPAGVTYLGDELVAVTLLVLSLRAVKNQQEQP